MKIGTKRLSTAVAAGPYTPGKLGGGTTPKGTLPPRLPKPNGPGVSIGELVGGVVLTARSLAEQALAAERARQARQREGLAQLARTAQDTFEKVAFTRVAFDPRIDAQFTPPKVGGQVNEQGWSLNVKFPRLTIRDLPNFIFTSPEE